jgi:MFS family permease
MTTTAAPAEPTVEPTVRAALGHARFRRLLTALAISQAGDWLYNVALVALVLDRTHSLTWVAVTTAARVTPMIVGGPFGGVVADRFDRRALMAWSDVVRAVCMAGLAAVALLHLPVVLAPVLAAIATAASTPYPPSVAATTPRLVPAELLPAANAARAAISAACLVAGPAFGAVLLLLGSTTVAFVVNGATFAVSALLVLSLPRGAAFTVERTESAAGVRAELAAGARALLEQPVALRLVGADFLCSAVYGAHTVLLLLLAHELGVGDAGYGYLLGAFGLGGVAATAMTGRIASRLSPRSLLLVAGVAVGVPAMLLGVPAPFVVLMAWAVLVGAGSIVVEVASDTALQTSVAPEVLARAYGISFPAAVSGIVLGSLVAAPLAGVFGIRGALAVLGAAMCAYVVTVVRTMPVGPSATTAGSVPTAAACETLPA